MSTSNSGFGMSGMPGMGAMGDTLGFMRRLWSGVNMPGMTVPSFSTDDINKQIADLKIVENWLSLNMNMLKATIQTLEVQSATLSALQSMGQQVGSSMGDQVEKAVGAAMDAAGALTKFGPMPGMSGMNAGSEQKPAQETSRPEPSASAETAFSFSPPTAEKPPAPEATEESPAAVASEAEPASPAAAAIPFVNPAAWWNMLQDQFKQAVDTAVHQTGLDAGSGEPGAKADGAAKRSSRPSSASGRSARPPSRTGNGKVGGAKAASKAAASKTRAGNGKAAKAATKPTGSARKSGARKKS